VPARPPNSATVGSLAVARYVCGSSPAALITDDLVVRRPWLEVVEQVGVRVVEQTRRTRAARRRIGLCEMGLAAGLFEVHRGPLRACGALGMAGEDERVAGGQRICAGAESRSCTSK
jgi:hypothetical protein